jgi:hypothetical protein
MKIEDLEKVDNPTNVRVFVHEGERYFSDTQYVALARALGLRSSLPPVATQDRRLMFHLEGSVVIDGLALDSESLYQCYIEGDTGLTVAVSLVRVANDIAKRMTVWVKDLLAGRDPVGWQAAV